MLRIAFAFFVIAGLIGCAANGHGATGDTDRAPVVTAPSDPSPEPATDSAANVLGDAELDSVMTAKLLHSRGLLSAIALEDFGRITQDARELLWLSERAAWLAHDTETYAALSAEFRNALGLLMEHARACDIDAVSRDYEMLSASCIDCHRYLKREGLIDPPGLISGTGAGGAIGVALASK